MEALFEARPDLDQDYAPNLIENGSRLARLRGPVPTSLDAAAALIGDNIIVTGSSFFCKKGSGGKANTLAPGCLLLAHAALGGVYGLDRHRPFDAGETAA